MAAAWYPGADAGDVWCPGEEVEEDTTERPYQWAVPGTDARLCQVSAGEDLTTCTFICHRFMDIAIIFLQYNVTTLIQTSFARIFLLCRQNLKFIICTICSLLLFLCLVLVCLVNEKQTSTVMIVKLKSFPFSPESLQISNAISCYTNFQCKHESARTDSFLDVPLTIRPFGSSMAYGSVVSAYMPRI